MAAERTTVLGVDGCPGGWVGALVDDAGSVTWLGPVAAATLLGLPAAAVGIDMPIGLPSRGARACDVAARLRLPGRGSTVFPAPVRAVLTATSYADARRLSLAASDRSLSAQAYGIVAKIAEVDALMAPGDERVVETHPEVSFARMAGRPLAPKTTARGSGERLLSLRPFVDAAAELVRVPLGVPLVDALDALACAWSARRWHEGRADVLGDGARDERGCPMRIVV